MWRIALTDRSALARHWGILDAAERDRANRFHRESDRQAFTISHGALREILAGYTGISASELEFRTEGAGKPVLSQQPSSSLPIHFNLSHSGAWALVAVSRAGPVGVDLEQWDAKVEFRELAEQFFSPAERMALLMLEPDSIQEGFFNAWSRKEAYLKATGAGITLGLHHFDVSLAPHSSARLIADRTDPQATTRWQMHICPVAPGYSAAVVAPVHASVIAFHDYSAAHHPDEPLL